MRKIDILSLEVYQKLRVAHEKCSINYHSHSNVIGVFMHELLIYFSNFFIIRESKYHYDQNISFPYLNSKYVNSPYKLKFFKRGPNLSKSDKFLFYFINYISIIFSLFRKKSLFFNINGSINISLKKLIFRAYRSFIPVYLINNSKVYLYKKDYQIIELKKTMNEICSEFKIPNNKIFVDNFINYVQTFCTSEKFETYKDNIYVTGSNTKISNRIDSANFNFFGGLTIECHHGEQAPLVLNEPFIGYATMSYCDYNLTYGKNCIDISIFNKPLFNHFPKLIYRSSDLIRSIYKSKKIEYKKITKDLKCLYIPTLLSNNLRYGPFRDIDDKDYIEWQNKLMDLDFDITYKAHPKNRQSHDYNYKKVENKNLKKVFDEFDFYIIDYISSAFSIICATDKPILYFNLGLRNMNKDALKFVKDRVFCVDIDLNDSLEKQINKGINLYNNKIHNFTNNYTNKYCLSEENVSEIDLLEKNIKELIYAN